MKRVPLLLATMVFYLACGGEKEVSVTSALEPSEPAKEEAQEAPKMPPMTAKVFASIMDRTFEALERRDIEGARSVCAEALETWPEEPNLLRLLALVEMVGQNYETVVGIANTALAKDPTSIPFLSTRAEANFWLQEMDQAQRDLSEIISELERKLANSSCKGEGIRVCSLESYSHALAGARLDLARTYYLLGDLDEAERIVGEVLETDPEDSDAQFLKALLLSSRGRDDEAEKIYKGLLKEDETCSACLNNLGVIEFGRHRFDRARHYFKEALKYTPDWDLRDTALLLSNMAELDILAGRFRAAEAKLRQAIATAWRYPGAYYNLAVLLDITGRTREARSAMLSALEYDPKELERSHYVYAEPEWKLYTEALVLEAKGRFEEAKVLFEEVAKGHVKMLRGPAKRHLNLEAPSLKALSF